jgi:hypothetical protein
MAPPTLNMLISPKGTKLNPSAKTLIGCYSENVLKDFEWHWQCCIVREGDYFSCPVIIESIIVIPIRVHGSFSDEVNITAPNSAC